MILIKVILLDPIILCKFMLVITVLKIINFTKEFKKSFKFKYLKDI